jgi:hypothetical protein
MQLRLLLKLLIRIYNNSEQILSNILTLLTSLSILLVPMRGQKEGQIASLLDVTV